MQSNSVDFDNITKGMRTKSDKIRALNRQGAATADIARYLGIRYQHARNVLVSSGLHTRPDDAATAVGPSSTSADEVVAWVLIDSNGRLQIPAALTKAAGIGENEPVHVRASEEGIEILSRHAALRRVREIARRFVPPGASLVDDLIAERRREAGIENG